VQDPLASAPFAAPDHPHAERLGIALAAMNAAVLAGDMDEAHVHCDRARVLVDLLAESRVADLVDSAQLPQLTAPAGSFVIL
jgi:hypothetical protein